MLKFFNILTTPNNTLHNKLHVFLNTEYIVVIFKLSGKYLIRKDNYMVQWKNNKLNTVRHISFWNIIKPG